jgi:uncharacterized glyoxalase superfamily protein PhnB
MVLAKRKIIHTRHVLAVKDLAVGTEYYLDKLGFERDFTVPGWEFLSFGDFKVMLGECADAMLARDAGDHSYYAHVLVENVDEIFVEFQSNGAVFTSDPEDKPWGLREFGVVTPDGHRIMFGQEIG